MFNVLYEQHTLLRLTDDEIFQRVQSYTKSDIDSLLRHPWTIFRAKKILEKALSTNEYRQQEAN
jgi:hypothetical protein